MNDSVPESTFDNADGIRHSTVDDVAERADLVLTTSGTFGIISAAPMARMKHYAIVVGVGFFDIQIGRAGLAPVPGSWRSSRTGRNGASRRRRT